MKNLYVKIDLNVAGTPFTHGFPTLGECLSDALTLVRKTRGTDDRGLEGLVDYLETYLKENKHSCERSELESLTSSLSLPKKMALTLRTGDLVDRWLLTSLQPFYDQIQTLMGVAKLSHFVVTGKKWEQERKVELTIFGTLITEKQHYELQTKQEIAVVTNLLHLD